ISLHGRRLEAANARLSREMRSQAAAVLRTRDGMIYGLAKLADYRDSDTGHHLDRICRYAVMLAEQMSTDRPEIDGPFIANLRLAASLHDIGKVGIPDRVLLKPGKLDDAERAIVERHAVIGASTLLSIRRRVGDDALLDMSIDIALRHHERWDGGGYPDGVSGEEIPLSARLVAVADVYDALTCERVYKPAMPHDQARTIIEEGAGAHFDPCVVEAFVEVADEFDAARRSLQPPKRLAA
ncbi:MAG: HD domain-containing phosphohydrolase, partial [Planctomycetota bacterium]